MLSLLRTILGQGGGVSAMKFTLSRHSLPAANRLSNEFQNNFDSTAWGLCEGNAAHVRLRRKFLEAPQPSKHNETRVN